MCDTPLRWTNYTEKPSISPLKFNVRTAHTLHIDRLYKINYSTIRMMLSFTHLNPPHLIYCTQYRRGSKECILWGFGRSLFFRCVRSLVFRLMMLACSYMKVRMQCFPIPFHVEQKKKTTDWREHSYFCYYFVRHVALTRTYAYENVWQYLYFSLVIDTCSRKNGISWLNYVNNRTWTVLKIHLIPIPAIFHIKYAVLIFSTKQYMPLSNILTCLRWHNTTDTKNGFFFTWKNMFRMKYIIKIKWHSSKWIRIGISPKPNKNAPMDFWRIFFFSFAPKYDIQRNFLTQVYNNKAEKW